MRFAFSKCTYLHRAYLVKGPYSFSATVCTNKYPNVKVLVCGGAADIYVDCKKQYNSSAMSCDRNIECVITAGNAKWCTGPKMKDCYIYDPYFTQDFQLVTKVNFFS